MPARFALALLALDGVGRVTAHRLLDRFPTADALRATPREQVLLRLKGAPKSERTVDLLFSSVFDDALAGADAEIGRLAQTGVRALAPGDPDWPAGLDALGRADRPVVLYAYGNAAALACPLLALLARPPVPADAFEAAQRAARRAVAAGAGLAVGAAHGFDLALQKVALGAGRAPVAVMGGGLATLAPSLRPAATALVRAGGLLLSPFPMTHGPFPHDDSERALVQAALGRAVLVVAPAEGSPESRAAAWAAGAGRPVALIGETAEPWAERAFRADDDAADDTVVGWLAPDAP
jgi:predicted Rossmann fold nucleotide-binding protein DprA/Smf involved in DNA uptake